MISLWIYRQLAIKALRTVNCPFHLSVALNLNPNTQCFANYFTSDYCSRNIKRMYFFGIVGCSGKYYDGGYCFDRLGDVMRQILDVSVCWVRMRNSIPSPRANVVQFMCSELNLKPTSKRHYKVRLPDRRVC